MVPLDHMGAEIKEDARETRCVAIPASGAPVWDEVLPLCTRVDLSEVAGFRVKLKNLESRWKKSDRLGIVDVSRQRLALSLTLDAPLAPGRAFAALRSMFVTPAQADVSIASWTAAAAGARSTAPVLAFEGIRAPAARFGRTEPSQHNLSAPDLVFDGFAAAVQR